MSLTVRSDGRSKFLREIRIRAYSATRSVGYATGQGCRTDISPRSVTEDFSDRPFRLALLHRALPEAAI